MALGCGYAFGMPLPSNVFADIQDVLESKVGTTRNCPMCDAVAAWRPVDGLMLIYGTDDMLEIVEGRVETAIAHAVMACDRCGHTVLFNLDMLGLGHVIPGYEGI
jgi:hypothetical protein